MNFRAFGRLACMALALSIGFEGTSFAQSRREAGVGSLLEMKCSRNEWGRGFISSNEDNLVINRRSFTAVGVFAYYAGGWNGPLFLEKGTPVESTCDLAGGKNRTPQYKNLTMTVGMADDAFQWQGRYSAKVRLMVYADGELVGNTEVGFRQRKRFSLDISNVRSVAFSVECFNPSNGQVCPVLWVLEDKLY